jgi:hypothetical protein
MLDAALATEIWQVLTAVPIAILRSTTDPAVDLRAVLIASKYAAVFGLLLLLGSSGLAPKRHGPPAA